MSSLTLPEKIKKRLEEESKKLGVSNEELLLEALSMLFKEPIDPESKVEIHSFLSEKYMKEAEEFLNKGDYAQASEKAWGAASQMVKAIASKRGKELRSHRELHEFVANLRKETNDFELSTLWSSATSLHQNFYENWLPKETVKDWIENVRRFIEKLKILL
ncbi:MAG: PaREP1 family protein [Candidatus Bathyarchaeia archaeon]